jgi:hypothetical protein
MFDVLFVRTIGSMHTRLLLLVELIDIRGFV